MTMVLRSLTDLMAVSRTVHQTLLYPWWRGQAVGKWALKPKVYRVPALDIYETNVISRFMQLAPARYPRSPEPEQTARWLFLAQHYGLPTRLLDWSESPLVALYFAVADEANDSKAGALWSLDPLALNFIGTKQNAVLTSQHPEVRRLINLALEHGAATDRSVVAVMPDEVDPRLMMQLAGFTLHGSPEPLEERGKLRRCLRKFLVPASYKSTLREELKTLGIRQRGIFPDLQNLAQDLTRGSF